MDFITDNEGELNCVVCYRTIFTQSNRHAYTDPDYMMTEEEGRIKHSHRDSYVMMLREMRQKRLNRIKAK